MLKFRSGDLFQSKAQTLVNTVNCRGVMGKGVALSFKREFPRMFRDYVDRCKARMVRPGEPYIFASNGRQVINFPTKDDWKRNSRLEYIESGLEVLRDNLHAWHVRSLAMPALGCGNGGLDWTDVKPLIQRYLGDADIDIEVFEPASASSSASEAAAEMPELGAQLRIDDVREPLPAAPVPAIGERHLSLFGDGTVDGQPKRARRPGSSTRYRLTCTWGRVESHGPAEPTQGQGTEVRLDDLTVFTVPCDGAEFIRTLQTGDELQACFGPAASQPADSSEYRFGFVVRSRDGSAAHITGAPGVNATPLTRRTANRRKA